MNTCFGQKQQSLSLARALADDPSILIMDDTTSAVDMETEAEIQKHLKEMDGGKTIVTIAQRLLVVQDSFFYVFFVEWIEVLIKASR